MKDKKIIFTLIITGCLLMIQSIVYFVFLASDKPDPYKDLQIEARTISNLTKSEMEVPDFSVNVTGSMGIVFDNDLVAEKNIPLYEFDAGIVDSFGTHVNTYVGVKLADFVEALNINDYYGMGFYNNRKTVNYLKTEIDTGLYYLVFFKDGKLINNAGISLLAVNHDYSYSLENILGIRVG